jgi:hypothetical protein
MATVVPVTVQVDFEGAPEQVKTGLPVNPPIGVTVIALEAPEPARTEAEAGFRFRENPGAAANVARTVLFWSIVTAQTAWVPEQAPDHPANTLPVPADSVRVTTVPEVKVVPGGS